MDTNVYLNTKIPTLKKLNEFIAESPPPPSSELSKQALSLEIDQLKAGLPALQQTHNKIEQSLFILKLLATPNPDTSILLEFYHSGCEIDLETKDKLTKWFTEQTTPPQTKLKQNIQEVKWPKNDLTCHKEIQTLAKFEPGLWTLPLVENTYYTLKYLLQTPPNVSKSFEIIEQMLNARLQSITRIPVDSPVDTFFKNLIPYISHVLQKFKINSEFIQALISFTTNLEMKFFIWSEICTQFLHSILDPQGNMLDYLKYERENYLKVAQQTEFTNKLVDVDVPSCSPNNWAVRIWKLLLNADYLLRLEPKLVLEYVHLPLVQHMYDVLETKIETLKLSKSTFARAVTTTKKEEASSEYLFALTGATSFLLVNLKSWSLMLLIAESGVQFDKTFKIFEELKINCFQLLAECLSMKLVNSIELALQRKIGSDFVPHLNLKSELANSKLDKQLALLYISENVNTFFWSYIHQNVFTKTDVADLETQLLNVIQQLSLNLEVFTNVFEAIKTLKQEESTLSSNEKMELRMRIR